MTDSRIEAVPAPHGRRSFRDLFILCAIQTALTAGIALTDSPTFLEPAHLASGISHWKLGRFELFRVNPPLVRSIAAIPALFMSPKTSWEMFFEHPGARAEFPVGREFFHENGVAGVTMLKAGRIVCLPFAILGTVICYLWAMELYGVWAARAVSLLWAFSPDVLAHGALITPDIAGASLGLAGCYAFWRWTHIPSQLRMLLTGFLLGLACLAKSTCIVLPVFGGLYWGLSQLVVRRSSNLRKDLVQMSAMLLIAMVVVNSGYVWDGVGTPLSDFRFVSLTLGGPSANDSPVYWGNRFLGTWLESIPCPLPEQFVYGLDIQKHDFESLNYPSYMAGELRPRGWASYYLYVWAVKLPIGVLTLAAFWLVSLGIRGRSTRWDEWFPVMLLLGLFGLVSAQTQFSHHGRYALPAYPFLLIALGSLFAGLRIRPLWTVGVWGLVGLSAVSSLSQYPHSLSYFNEFAGGPQHGGDHLIDSNLDWGQDLDRLRSWMAQQDLQEPINLYYYSHLNPEDLGMEYRVPTESPVPGGPLMLGVQPGWYAISVSLLRGYPHGTSDGQHGFLVFPEFAGSWLRRLHPVVRIGRSIEVYQVSEHDLEICKQQMKIDSKYPQLQSTDLQVLSLRD